MSRWCPLPLPTPTPLMPSPKSAQGQGRTTSKHPWPCHQAHWFSWAHRDTRKVLSGWKVGHRPLHGGGDQQAGFSSSLSPVSVWKTFKEGKELFSPLSITEGSGVLKPTSHIQKTLYSGCMWKSILHAIRAIDYKGLTSHRLALSQRWCRRHGRRMEAPRNSGQVMQKVFTDLRLVGRSIPLGLEGLVPALLFSWSL